MMCRRQTFLSTKHLIRTGWLLLCLWNISGLGYAAADIEDEFLRIDWAMRARPPLPPDPNTGVPPPAPTKEEWNKSCSKLGESLLAGKGPWGMGVFAGFTCMIDGESSDGKSIGPSSWYMKVEESATNVELKLYRVDPNKKIPTSVAPAAPAKPVAQTPPPPGTPLQEVGPAIQETSPSASFGLESARATYARSAKSIEFLQDDEFADLIAFQLLDALPMAYRLTKESLQGSPPKLPGRVPRSPKDRDPRWRLPDPPAELTIYKLSFDEATQSYAVKVVGSAKQTNAPQKPEDKAEQKEQKDRMEFSAQEKKENALYKEASWNVDGETLIGLQTGRFWGHSTDGRGSKFEELNKKINEATVDMIQEFEGRSLADILKSFLLNNIAAGFIGARYGFQIGPAEPGAGETMIKTMKTINLLGEFRSGMVEGLRVYWDFIPPVEEPDEYGGKYTFRSTRLTFGRSFGMSFGKPVGMNFPYVFNRVDVVPKMGYWTMEGNLPFDSTIPHFSPDDNGVPESELKAIRENDSLTINKQLSVGIEVGVELTRTWYMMRGWMTRDLTLSFLNLLEKDAKVDSFRIGLDTYWLKGPKFTLLGLPIKSAILGSISYERTDIRKKIVGDPNNEEAVVLFTPTFASIGMAVSW